MKTINNYREQIYAGVLGKIIGVYLGRPVEGWTYEKIMEQFGEINFYKNTYTGAPLIVPDDDISGTFAFIRALYDNNYKEDIEAKQIGDTWLNYIVENKTILWWGGLSRSTEHTAFLRLKNGIKAPKTGSIELNGRSMAEQIGAQIFIDTWAMVNPNNPERAVKMAKKAASVSHDGIAVEAACYLAAIESMAFYEKDIDALLDKGLNYISDEKLKGYILELRKECMDAKDWHEVRRWIAKNYGYDKFPGNCPMVTNHLVLLMALILGGDDFQKSIMIASSAGWDTDCNSGNVGALNGIRLGLDGINAGNNFRKSVADRMYICTSDGGSCVTDAVIEARKLIFAAAKLNGEDVEIKKERFSFEFNGAVQGFIPYPDCTIENALLDLCNSFGSTSEYGLKLSYSHLGKGMKAAVSVDTFVDMVPKGKVGTSYFDVIASPSLYETQTVKAHIFADNEINPKLRFFIDCYDENEQIKKMDGAIFDLNKGDNEINWEVPSTDGRPIYRFGIELFSENRIDGSVIVKSIDWDDAPRAFRMGKSMAMTPSLTPWTTETAWLKSFVNSCENFCPDYTTTFSISHPTENGVVTIGTDNWKNYSVESTITFSQQKKAGLVARAKGHRRYYCAVFKDKKAIIGRRIDDEFIELAATDFLYEIDSTYRLKFELIDDKLRFFIDGDLVCETIDNSFCFGGAGFLVEEGAILGNGFEVYKK